LLWCWQWPDSRSGEDRADQAPIAFIQIMSYALPFGAVMAAGTGWYKRFLAAMPGSRPRQQRPQRRKAK